VKKSRNLNGGFERTDHGADMQQLRTGGDKKKKKRDEASPSNTVGQKEKSRLGVGAHVKFRKGSLCGRQEETKRRQLKRRCISGRGGKDSREKKR